MKFQPQCDMDMHLSYQRYSGFTIVELIIVVVVIGIIAVTIVPRWTASSMNLSYEAFRVLNDIRYVQALSLTTGERYRFSRRSATSYQITNESGTPVVLPNGATQVTFTNDIQFGGFNNLPNNVLVFDSAGTPYIDTTLPGTPLASTASIPLIQGGLTRTIQITPQTGLGVLN